MKVKHNFFHSKVRYNRIMLILRDRLQDLPILSLQTGSEIARVGEPIIEPQHLAIIAFYCSGDRLDVSPAILHTIDIREFSNLGFIVDSADDLMSPDDLVRLQQILDLKFELIGKRVIDTLGKKIGKVNNYILDSRSFFIKKICVKPTMLQAWDTTEVIIDRTQIERITDTEVVVKAPTVPKEDSIAEPSRAVHNPFRKAHPQPDTATTEQQR